MHDRVIYIYLQVADPYQQLWLLQTLQFLSEGIWKRKTDYWTVKRQPSAPQTDDFMSKTFGRGAAEHLLLLVASSGIKI